MVGAAAEIGTPLSALKALGDDVRAQLVDDEMEMGGPGRRLHRSRPVPNRVCGRLEPHLEKKTYRESCHRDERARPEISSELPTIRELIGPVN